MTIPVIKLGVIRRHVASQKERRFVDGVLQPPDDAHAQLRNAAAHVNAAVSDLSRLAHELGLAEGGPFGNGPDTDAPTRDVARSLFVAFRALLLIEGLALDPEYRDENRTSMRRAYNVLLGGRPDSAKGHHIRMAVAVARQAIMMVNHVGFHGFPQQTLEAQLVELKKSASDLFGPVLLDVDDTKLAPFLAVRGYKTSDEAHVGIEKDARQLAAVLLWEGAEIAKQRSDATHVFYFPLEAGDTSRRRLLARIQTSENGRRPKRSR